MLRSRKKSVNLSSILVLMLVTVLFLDVYNPIVIIKGNGTGINVLVNPPISLVKVNGTCAVEIDVFNVTNLYAFQFSLSYNTTFVNTTDITLGSFLNEPTWTFEQIDEPSGTISYLATSLFPAQPVSGSGTLAIVNFTIEGEGDTTLNLYSTVLADQYGSPISHDTFDGSLHTVNFDVAGHVPDELLVEFYLDATEEAVNETISRLGTRTRGSSVQWGLGDDFKIYWLKITSNRTVFETVNLFLQEPIVKFAEPIFAPDPLLHQTYPDDLEFYNQWGMLNAGQMTVAKETTEQIVWTEDQEIGTLLIRFLPNEKHDELVQGRSGWFDIGECIYRDVDNDDTVSIGDTRLTPCTAGAGSQMVTYPVGSQVQAQDEDIDIDLVSFQNDEKHDERVRRNGAYEFGEWIYLDADFDGRVSVYDIRIIYVGTIDADIDAPQAWSLFEEYNLWRNGNPIVVILDTGADANHPDLIPNLLYAQAPDLYGHGTHVAGIVGAVGDNNLDVAGVNWHAQIVSLHFDFFHVNLMSIILLKRIFPIFSVRVINYSARFIRTYAIGDSVYIYNRYDEMAETLIAEAENSDILFVAAAGNDAVDVDVGEYIYRDVDGNGIVSAGDIRLTEVTAFHPGPFHPPQKDATRTYDAGTQVSQEDWDGITANVTIGFTQTELITFATEDLDRNGFLDPANPFLGSTDEDVNLNGLIDPVELYDDADSNFAYSPGEPIYYDRDANGFVSQGDMRLKPPVGMQSYTMVQLVDPDFGTILRNFALDEKHVDNKHVDGRPRSVHGNLGLYEGPGVYPACFDLDNIISVASMNHLDHISDFSNYGKDSVDLAAPGEDIISLSISVPGRASNVVVMSGTSMAAPHVTGIASLAFALIPERTALEVKQDILSGNVGNLHPCPDPERIPPASAVDRRPPFGSEWKNEFGQVEHHPILVSDGRLRWPYTGDLGDAPDNDVTEFYDTVAALEGALHWDTGNEWFGLPLGRGYGECSNEVGALWPDPRDEDQTKNPNLPCRTIPDHDDWDHPQPTNFWFDPEPPWFPGQQVTVHYWVSTNYLGVNDAEGGRYQSVPNRMIYVNGFFDWNWNHRFDGHAEHSVHQPHDLTFFARPGSILGESPPRSSFLWLSSTFIAQGTPRWIRFRIDYGEDVGHVDPNPPIPEPPIGAITVPTPWSMFHHDPSHTGYTTSTAPITNNTLWTFTTGGVVYSSPAVDDGLVFFGSTDNYVYALDAVTGSQKWQFRTENQVQQSSPAVSNFKVIIGSTDGKIYALDEFTGRSMWNYTANYPVYSSPAVSDGRVFIASSSRIYALNEATGSLIWSYPSDGTIFSSPAVAEGRLYIGDWTGKVYALNAVTGTSIWNYTTGGPVTSSPAVAGSRVYVGSRDDRMYALNTANGALAWSYTTGGYVESSPAIGYGMVFFGSHDGYVYALNAITGLQVWRRYTGAVSSSPAIASGRVYVGSSDHRVYALVVGNGAHVWNYTTGNAIAFSSPAIANGIVYIGSTDRGVYAFTDLAGCIRTPTIGIPGFLPDPIFPVSEHYHRARFGEVEDWPLCTFGETIWPTYQLDVMHTGYTLSFGPCSNNTIWSCTLGSITYSSPAVAEGKVFIGSNDKNVYAIDAETGTEIWNYTTGNWIGSSPAIADGRVFIGSSDGYLYALNATNGSFLWKYATGGGVASPTVAGGVVYIGGNGNDFHALNASTGASIWIEALEGFVECAPAVAEGKVFFSCSDGYVYALNATNHDQLWRYSTGYSAVASPSVADGRLYIGSIDQKVYCLDAETGNFSWSYTTDGIIQGCPAVVGGKVFIGSLSGSVYCLNAETGALFWSTYLEAPIYGSPLVACQRKIYVPTAGETIYALDPAKGTILWTYYTGSGMYGSPALASGTLYVASYDGKLRAFRSRHDVSVLDAVASKTAVGEGYTVKIDVTVKNKGDLEETFDVILGANNTMVEQAWIVLSPGGIGVITFTWNTTGFAYGKYMLSICAVPVHYEAYLPDNAFFDVWLTVSISGDIDGSFKVDGKDIAIVAKAYGTTPGHPKWDPRADINDDLKVDGKDISIVAKNYGKSAF